MKIRKRLAALPLTALVTLASNAQQAPTAADEAAAARANAEQQQQLQRQREAQAREASVSAPSVRSDVPKAGTYPALPTETPCFRIDRFTLDAPATLPQASRINGASALPLDPFAFAREWIEHYQGQCVGKAGLDVLTRGLQQVILSRGYVTTRVLVGQQDLSTGTLAFTLLPGIVRAVRFADASTYGTLRTAFPVSGGDLLNLRDLEQGLEQMKRVPNQDVDMQIVPTDTAGESDVVVSVKRSKPWTFVVSADNSGTDATGKWQGNVSLGLNNPLGLNDILSLGANQDLSFGNKSLGSHGFNGSYSVPWGYWTATLSGNTNTYYQPIAGTGGEVYVSSGNSQTAALRLARVLSRSQNDVLGAYFQFSKRFGMSFLEDTEVPNQARNNTFIELGATDRHYFGAAQFDGSLAYRQGTGGFGATPDPYPTATYRFHMAVLDANLSVPFAIGNQRFAYVGTIHGQFTANSLYYIDDLTIGSRYTVRGFDGNTMLAGEKGFYWRNELQWPVFQTGQMLYAGIDYGHVYGPGTAAQAGTQLAGAVIGIRGGVPAKYVGLSYDLFVGTPIYKPSDFPTSRVTVGIQATAQF